MQLYSNSFALVIGIDNYDIWPRLSQAIADAEMVASVLEGKGFEVILKKNLNGRDLETAFEDFFIDKGASPEARLFVWYAGHGHTVDGEGYLIPADGVFETDRSTFLKRSVSLRDFGKYSRLAQAKHVYTIFDSCFAGTIFNVARSSPPPAITRVTSEPVRQFLTSGDAGQTVSDDGTFARLFVESLEGKRRADLNADGYVTAEELGVFLTSSISNYTNNKQVPRYGKLRDPNFDRGDFVFIGRAESRQDREMIQKDTARQVGARSISTVDLTKLKPTHVSVGWETLSINKDSRGFPIKIKGKLFQSGIWAHAESRLIYSLSRRFDKFEANIGLSWHQWDCTGGDGAIFIVMGDGRPLYSSRVMNLSVPAEQISVDVSGVKELELVTKMRNGNLCDATVWADPRLIAKHAVMWFKRNGHFAKNEISESEVSNEYSKNQTEFHPRVQG